jgi:hypothetical protein
MERHIRKLQRAVQKEAKNRGIATCLEVKQL